MAALASERDGEAHAALAAARAAERRWRASAGESATGQDEAALSLLLGRALLANGQAAEAEAALARHVELLGFSSPASPALAAGRAWLGNAALANGRPARARELAASARDALARQPEAGPHWRQPLATLESHLARAGV